MRRILATAVTLALAGTGVPAFAQGQAPAAPAAQSQAVTTQLPRTARPSHYRVEVTPHAEKMAFDGRISIDLEVLEQTSSIVLQAADLRFANSMLVAAGGKPMPAKVSVDAENQTASFSFDKPLSPGRYTLTTDYSGVINTQANGLFALDYPTEAGSRRALFTQFENSDARRFIPSWDEPGFKATFDLAITVPEADMAVSNMPVASSRALGNGLKQVVFQTTPKMSTYLLFVAAGDFERAAMKDDNGTEIGVITQKGKVEQARFAMEGSRDVLREYNDYFGVPYPLPKLDNVAAPGSSQFFSAMENWGAIFTFEHTLLLDPAVSGVSDKQRVFSVAAHEIAHQWFGNLVTMAWWDDLWLNEGFASWMEERTTRKLHPEWDVNDVGAAMTSRGAMGRDAYATTHPIVQHVATVEQASQAFDGITYGKGAAVIAMFEDYVGADAWREGVRSYVRAHAYGNAVTDDLWREMDKAAPGKRFVEVAHDFTLQPGVPLIRVASQCVDGRTQVMLTQGEYTLDRKDKVPLRWRVPVTVRGADGTVARTLVDGNGALELPGCAGPVLVNAGQKGYYRTLYAPEQFKALGQGFARLPVVDQLGMMMDASALAAVGLQPESDVLDLTAQVPADAPSDLWEMVSGTLGGIDVLFKGDAPRQAAFRRYARSRLSPVLQSLGWDAREDDSAQTRQLRSGLIRMLSTMGDEQVIAEARRRFDAFLANPESLPADLRRTVLGVVARNADAATWDKLHALAKKETSSMVRDQYYGLLAQAKDKALAQRALDMALTDEPGATNAAEMIGLVAHEHADMAFDFAVAHREKVDTLVDSTSRARYYPGLAMGSDDPRMVDKIRTFAEQHIAPTSRRDAETAITGIQTRLKLRAERKPQIDAWLKKNGY
ncbi:M1 family peptidase [Stenotrophomonas sp. MYb238]|uniref:M1 family metallopeptidase n=1 Tax=Stenotrophomonas sp. MYb238 TaxID=2040281 RepID=UPI001291FEE7|nr:M1 family metallopeptidase [Stenotrophomonas sp. MYb238]MQP76498.1 M1 family peptidase [Stenotrophomonas sp. MYb238]